jgi:hypothetical protein
VRVTASHGKCRREQTHHHCAEQGVEMCRVMRKFRQGVPTKNLPLTTSLRQRLGPGRRNLINGEEGQHISVSGALSPCQLIDCGPEGKNVALLQRASII